MRARLVRIVLIVVAAEVVGAGLFAPSGRRLQTVVDLLTIDGILLALGGAFLVVDTPFLAARRALARPGSPARDPAARRTRRSLGWFVLLMGVLLYGTAALVWAAQGGIHGIDG